MDSSPARGAKTKLAHVPRERKWALPIIGGLEKRSVLLRRSLERGDAGVYRIRGF